MRACSTAALIGEMRSLRRLFHHCRAYFPRIPLKQAGAFRLSGAPYYSAHGYPMQFLFSSPITPHRVRAINAVGLWVNKSYVVHLCAMLESYGIISDSDRLDQSLPGWREVDLVRRLRNVFAHTTGTYNPRNRKHRLLARALVQHLGLTGRRPPGFPLAIDDVLDPLFEGCRNYVLARSRGKGDAV